MSQPPLNDLMALGNQRHQLGQLHEAETIYRQVLAAEPQRADALCALAEIAMHVGKRDAAIELMQRAIRLKPGRPEPLNNLGIAYLRCNRPDEARQCFTDAMKLNPSLLDVRYNLAGVVKDLGRASEAIELYRGLLKSDPDATGNYSDLLLALHYDPNNSPETIAAEHRLWNERYAAQLAPREESKRRDDDRETLRVGYVSSDFRRQSVAFFLLPLIENHDHARFHVTCYSAVMSEDAVSERFQGSAARWRRIIGLTDEQVAEMVRADGIDILVNMSGHTSGNRLLLFARKPAPIQVTYLGYPNTTGLGTMDYRLTDAISDPPGLTEKWHSERLFRLPTTNWCFTPLSGSPPVGRLPAESNGYVTFGSFNHSAKINEPLLKMWAAILASVDRSALVLKNPATGSAEFRRNIDVVFRSQGIESGRVKLLSCESAPEKHLECYNQIDIGLDSYPYHGTTTTCEALWMGVPTVTLTGEAHYSRVGASLLSTVGLNDLVARRVEEYVRIAGELAADLPRLREIRSNLREKMSASPLMDGPRFAREVERAYEQMWRTWCVGDARS